MMELAGAALAPTLPQSLNYKNILSPQPELGYSIIIPDTVLFCHLMSPARARSIITALFVSREIPGSGL